MSKNLLAATCSFILCQVVLAQSGNSLALREGPSNVDRAYGSDVFVDFPSVYTSGQYTLSWYQNVDPTVDTIHQVIVVQNSGADFTTGLNAVTDPLGQGIGNQSGMPSYIPMQWDLSAPGPPFRISGSKLGELEFGVWAQHVVAIDLDADTFSYSVDGANLVRPGTRWDNPNDSGPALAGILSWTGLAGPDADANENGIDGYIRLDDFLLTDSSGNVVWSEDFESGLGSFRDLPGNVPAIIVATTRPHIALYNNMDLEPIDNIPGAIGPRFTSNQEDNAQQFLVGEHTNVSSVSLLLNKVGSPTGEVKVEIWEDREPGVPSSLVTTVGAIDLAELPNERTEVTFDSLVTGLTPDSAYHVVLNNLDASITSAQDSYRVAVLGNTNDPQKEGTNGAAFMLGSSPEESNGAWTPVLDSLGCHPSGGCPNFQRMTVTAATLLGDFDEDGQLDADDIDALSLEIRNGSNDRSFDLNNSATLTGDDHGIWVEQLAGTFVGDTNLDGEVDFPDFLLLSAGFGQPGGWADGDVDGNGQVEFPDFLALSANFGQSSVAAASVPEPSSLCLLSLALIGIVRIGLPVSRKAM